MEIEINAILVDDEKSGLNVISKLLKKYCPHVNILAECRSADEAKEKIETLKPNLILLDITMPGKNAFEMLEEITDRKFEIIFITAHSQYSIQAFRYSAVDYLLKPVAEDLLVQAVERVQGKIKNKTDNNYFETLIHNLKHLQKPDDMKLCIPNIKGFEVVNVKDIIYCEAESCYTVLHFQNRKKITVAKTISDYEELLKDTTFCRVHKSFLINLTYVKEYIKGEGGKIILSNNAEIEVSRRKKDHFLSMLKSNLSL